MQTTFPSTFNKHYIYFNVITNIVFYYRYLSVTMIIVLGLVATGHVPVQKKIPFHVTDKAAQADFNFSGKFNALYTFYVAKSKS